MGCIGYRRPVNVVDRVDQKQKHNDRPAKTGCGRNRYVHVVTWLSDVSKKIMDRASASPRKSETAIVSPAKRPRKHAKMAAFPVSPGESVRPFLIAGLTCSLTMGWALCCALPSCATTSAVSAKPGIPSSDVRVRLQCRFGPSFLTVKGLKWAKRGSSPDCKNAKNDDLRTGLGHRNTVDNIRSRAWLLSP